jgi:chromosome segregation ATPase
MAAEQESLQSASKKAAEEHAVALENLRREADAAADGLKSRITALEADLESSRHVRGDSEAKLTQLKTQLAEARGDNEALAKERDQWQRQKADLDAALAEARAAAQTEHQTQSAALATAEGRNAELESRLAAIESDKSALTASLAETNEKIAAANESLAAAHRQIETLEASTADRGELARQLEDVRKTLAAREKATRDLQASLDEAKQELAAANEQTCPRSELSELQHKFDIALADVQKLKQENAALRDELASRPATSDADSPELIALRSEREALESRVAELEKAAQAAADATSQQDFEDLERRFEMAVDDVRELKQENAQLRDQIAKSKPDGAAAAHSGPFDWAAQKARLLAALAEEEGAGPMDGERKKERLSIQKTIEATDRLIAEKERQIAELHANQLQADSRVPTGPSREEAAKELLDADELVSQERLRLGKLQSECEEKMRAAELELSVERAKLAREQALLKERLFELQKLTPKGDADDALGKPRRRWLSALGLGDDGDDQGKKQA